jgi:hypothetical protein
MAEVLIIKKRHWMDGLPPGDLNNRKKNSTFLEKYNRRVQPGDIAEVRPDGWPHSDREREEFHIVKIPETPEECKEGLEQSHIVDGQMLLKRKYKLDLAVLSQSEQSKFDAKDILALTDVRFTQLLRAKV